MPSPPPGDDQRSASAGPRSRCGAGDRRRFLVLAICCTSLFIVGLDNTAVNVALPDLRADLGASTSELQWTVSAYTLVLASLLVLAGSTGDRVGRARTFQVGLTLFTLGSLLCSVAGSVHLLIAFRMLQAVGGSMLNPVAMSIIRNTFEDPANARRRSGCGPASSACRWPSGRSSAGCSSRP